MADPPIGETPMIPMSILKYSKSQGGFQEDPVITLSKVSLHLLETLSVEPGTPKVKSSVIYLSISLIFAVQHLLKPFFGLSNVGPGLI